MRMLRVHIVGEVRSRGVVASCLLREYLARLGWLLR
jgi:hypothetical protein